MTTNHRPTLESKRGKVQSITDSISHARLLSQQTQLKYRSDLDNAIIDHKTGKKAVEELRLELLRNEGRLQDNKHTLNQITDGELSGSEWSKQDDGDEVDRHNKDPEIAEEEQESIHDNLKVNEGDGEGFEESDGSVEEYSSSEEESEDETAQLMVELAKIKKERQEEKAKKELQEKTRKAISSNPLIRVLDSSSSANDFKVKKSWRSGTAFKNKATKPKNEEESFTNDTLNSDFHQKFLSKYVR